VGGSGIGAQYGARSRPLAAKGTGLGGWDCDSAEAACKCFIPGERGISSGPLSSISPAKPTGYRALGMSGEEPVGTKAPPPSVAPPLGSCCARWQAPAPTEGAESPSRDNGDPPTPCYSLGGATRSASGFSPRKTREMPRTIRRSGSSPLEAKKISPARLPR
jgi:hypothetical protein